MNRTTTPGAFLALLLTTACISDSGNNIELRSGINTQTMDNTVNPGDDFHQFANGTWLNNTAIPDDRSSYGTTAILREEAEENVKTIIEESAAGDFETGSNEQMVGDLYKSFMDIENRNSLGITPLNDEFALIDAIDSHEALAAHFGEAIKYYDVPFSYGVFADLKEPTKYGLYYFQSGLGLPDKEYYFKEDEKSVEIRRKYVEHIGKMLVLAGLPDAKAAADKIMALETRLADANMSKEQTRNLSNLYNNYSADSLKYLMPAFSWSAYLKSSEVDDIDRVIIGMVDYSRALDEIIASTDLDTWKLYLKWKFVDAAASYLSEALDQQNFEFFGKTLYGRKEQREHWRRGVTLVNNELGEVVGKVYVERHFPPKAKERMTQLVDNLIGAYEQSINDLEWMSDSTKVQALDKLSKFTPKIGYPDIWKDYSGLVIKENDLLGNKVRANLALYARNMKKLRGPILKHEWGMSPQTVNAYYNPTLNEIVFPAAILQPPIFDLSVDDAVNYGAVGSIIGHEIGHGFDDNGSQFDGNGQMRNWWTEEDKSRFEDRTSALVEQFNGYQVFDDLNVNGQFTLGENIGDLGGLHIALKAYRIALNGQEGPVMDGFTAMQRFFLGYAQAWQYKAREEAMRVRINSDPHSPPRFRVNGIVRNIPEFYEAFDVQEGDSLFLAPDQRVKIW